MHGIDISETHDLELLSICPQFNWNLCDEMTREHFLLYGLLNRMDTGEMIRYLEELIEMLELTICADKSVLELRGGGNPRKLAVP
jgi:ABC-type Na+ transport system ATPase subunit NatA